MGGQLAGALASRVETGMSRAACGVAPPAARLTARSAIATGRNRMTRLLLAKTISEIPESVQTVKLSPHPQAPLALGFSNTNPAAKSSSHQSMTDPTR